MVNTLYIASSLLNRERVQQLRDKFATLGVGLTYDWSKHGCVLDKEQLRAICVAEYEGVCRAKCVLLVWPARLGSHFEAGVAYGRDIPIVFLEDVPVEIPTSFHFLPNFQRCTTEDEAIALVMAHLQGQS